MSPEIFEKWQNIIEDVDKTKIPVELIKKLILKLHGRKQRTINIASLIRQGFESEEIENMITNKLQEYDDELIGVEFILDIESIAEMVQPTTDKMLRNL
jgi:hypothetical protein